MIYERGQSFYKHHQGKFLSGKEKLETNEKQAIFYYEKAASQNSIMALKSMAWYYFNGFYVKQDAEAAKKFAEKAIFGFSADTFLSEGVELQNLFDLLSWYYFFEKNDMIKSLEYSLRSLKENNKADWTISVGAVCLRKIAKNKTGKVKEQLYKKNY
jgi:hypothetical protein